MTSTTRCAIYLRQSIDATGEGLAIDRQREDCRKLAEQRGWSVVAEFADNSISASGSKVRLGYDALVQAFTDGAFDALVCWDLDRLTRQPRQLEDWIDAAERSGLLLVTANGEADLSTDGGRLFARIKAAVARSEVERKAARQARAALQRSETGRPPLGVRLRGYSPAGDVIEAEAAPVRECFERFAAGDSLRGIAAWLAGSAVPTRHGRPWNPSSVRTLLTNPRYCGRAIYRGAVTGRLGGWTPLVDEATFDLVQARLTDPRRRTQVGTDRRHLGSGLFRCGVCGLPVVAWSAGRYRCPAGCVTRKGAPIDALVLAVIRGVLGRPDLANLLPVQDERGRVLAGELTRLRARLATIEADYDLGLIDGRRFAVARDKITIELRAAEQAHARAAASSAATALLAGDPMAAFDSAAPMLRRGVINLLATVRLHRAPRGRREFDPASISVEPRMVTSI